MITLPDIKTAYGRIFPYIIHTPLLRVSALDETLGCQVYLKLECVQVTGSFKLRGALNKVASLSESERERGVVCSSSGNHAQGVALASKMFGADAKIVMPEGCNPVKIEKTKQFGGNTIIVGKLQREAVAASIAKSEGRVLIHAFADSSVQAGQGTIGLEMLQDEPELDAVVVPVGGGGLFTGIAVAVKTLKPDIHVYGIEHENVGRYTNCLKLNKVADIDHIEPTIADGVVGTHADAECFEAINTYADALLLTDDGEIKLAIKELVSKAHVVAEPASCMTVAAAMSKNLPLRRDEKVAFVLSGGNNDLNLLANILLSANRI